MTSWLCNYRNFTEDIEAAVDNVSSNIADTSNFDIYEPFIDVNDRLEDDLYGDDAMRHTSNDVENWFD